MRYIAGFTFGEVLAKDIGCFAAYAGLHQKSGKVRARNQLGVADELQRPFVGPFDAYLGQALRHFHGALFAAASRVAQTLLHVCIVGIKAQAHNVHGFAGKGDRDLGAGEVIQPLRPGGGGSPLLAADLVMVSQCPQLHAIGLGALCQGLRGQGAV